MINPLKGIFGAAGKAFGGIWAKVVTAETAVLLATLAALGASVHIWKDTVAEAEQAKARTVQVQATLTDTQNQLHQVILRQKQTEALLEKYRQSRETIARKTERRLQAIQEAQDHASKAYQQCRTLRLPSALVERLRGTKAGH